MKTAHMCPTYCEHTTSKKGDRFQNGFHLILRNPLSHPLCSSPWAVNTAICILASMATMLCLIVVAILEEEVVLVICGIRGLPSNRHHRRRVFECKDQRHKHSSPLTRLEDKEAQIHTAHRLARCQVSELEAIKIHKPCPLPNPLAILAIACGLDCKQAVVIVAGAVVLEPPWAQHSPGATMTVNMEIQEELMETLHTSSGQEDIGE